MKKILTLLFVIAFIGKLNAQNEKDVLNLSQYFVGGTARGISMSGAYGALGGDLSSLSINPAGIGVYRSSELVFSPGFTLSNTQSDFHGTSYSDSKNTINLGNIGIVLNSNSNKDIGWVSASFGFAYNKLIDFNKNITITGVNNTSSYLDEFLLYANSGSIDSYYEDLAINSNAIFYSIDDGYYLNDFKDFGYGQDQRRMINLKGNVGEYVLSFGANYSNNLFLGATLGIQSVDYSEEKIHDEYNIPGTQLSSFTFNDYFSYKGVGYNFKIGAIYKPIDFLRLGFAFHTPTYYSVKSDYSTDMHTWFYSANENKGKDVYSDFTEYDFKVTSPLKLIFSGALQGKLGVLSFDYEYVDYSASKIRGDNDPFTDVNQTIQDIYRVTGNLKIGGELKLDQFALRAGYGYYGSPYNSNHFNKNANTQTYSAGFGYRGENFFIDFGYILFDTKYKYNLYSYEAPDSNNNWQVYDERADLESKINRFVVTVGFRF
jgi:hypothetical protein